MPSTPIVVRDSIPIDTLRPVVYEPLVLVAMLAVLGLSLLLPGADRTLPELAATVREVIVATSTVAIVVWLAHTAPRVAALARASLVGPEQVVEDAGRVTGATVAFAAVLVTYRGLAGLVIPSLVSQDSVWAYDLAFFVIALGPLAVIASRLRRNLDVIADQLAGQLADGRWVENGDRSESA